MVNNLVDAFFISVTYLWPSSLPLPLVGEAGRGLLIIVLLKFEFPEVGLHGLLAAGGVLLGVEGGLVLGDLGGVLTALVHGLGYRRVTMPYMVSMGIMGIICIMVGFLLVWVSFWLIFYSDPTVRSRSGRGHIAVLTRKSVDFSVLWGGTSDR